MYENESSSKLPLLIATVVACVFLIGGMKVYFDSRSSERPDPAVAENTDFQTEQPAESVEVSQGYDRMPSDPVRLTAEWGAVKLDQAELLAAINRCGDYFVSICDEQGKFVYEIHLDPQVRMPVRYNIIRHAGVMYSLARIYEVQPREDIKQALVRSAGYLKNLWGPNPEEEKILAIWSLPHINNVSNLVAAKLGGAGLGLVGLVCTENIAPGTTRLEHLRKMAEFILFMQKPDGSFYSQYAPSRGGFDPRFQVLYYPGEAALGLLMLYELDNNPRWLNAAQRAFAALATERAEQSRVVPDHWALIAMPMLIRNLDQCENPLARDKHLFHSVQIQKALISGKKPFPPRLEILGCITGDGRTTPTACRLEGLIASYGILKESSDVPQSEMDQTIERGLLFLLRTQVRHGRHVGAIPAAMFADTQGYFDFDEVYNPAAAEVRIDYVQHAVSAMVSYYQLKYSK